MGRAIGKRYRCERLESTGGTNPMKYQGSTPYTSWGYKGNYLAPTRRGKDVSNDREKSVGRIRDRSR